MNAYRNYIPDVNRFKLSGPPRWWLDSLWNFDDSLVVIPSRQNFLYRLAQRRPPNLSESVVNEALFNQSDTQMLASYGLIPVTSILSTANWSNPYLFEELRRRAPWRLGGSEKVITDLETREQMEELDKRAKTDEHLTYLGRDGWNLYNKKIGLRSHMYSPRTKDEGRTPKSGVAPSLRIK